MYHPLANCTCFISHQVSTLVGGSSSEQVASLGHQMSLAGSSGKQVWTGLQFWPTNVTSGRPGGSLHNAFLCLRVPVHLQRGGGSLYRALGPGGHYMVKPNALLLSNGHTGPPPRPPVGQTGTTENINFPQLCWWAIMCASRILRESLFQEWEFPRFGKAVKRYNFTEAPHS